MKKYELGMKIVMPRIATKIKDFTLHHPWLKSAIVRVLKPRSKSIIKWNRTRANETLTTMEIARHDTLWASKVVLLDCSWLQFQKLGMN